MLEQDRHKIGDHDYSQKRVAELGTPSQISGPVSWIHVADRDQKSRARESDELPTATPDPRSCARPGAVPLQVWGRWVEPSVLKPPTIQDLGNAITCSAQ